MPKPDILSRASPAGKPDILSRASPAGKPDILSRASPAGKPDKLFFDSINETFYSVTPFGIFYEGTGCLEQRYYDKIKSKYSKNKYFLNMIKTLCLYRIINPK